MKLINKGIALVAAILITGVSYAEIKGKAMNWKEIDKQYTYENSDLGLTFDGKTPTIKLWAPLAEKVDLVLFDKKDQTKEICKIPMTKKSSGIWQITFTPENCSLSNVYGYFYQFELKNPNLPIKRILDPYARSMAAVTVSRDGSNAGESNDYIGKAAIINPSLHGKVNSIKQIKGFSKSVDAVIYEVHVRDFTSDPTISNELKHHFGTYKAFIEKLPYIKDLGVTHVQLLPVMAWYLGDETKMKERDSEWSAKSKIYNWGYDPHNYFSPDGAYSENPNDPALRIEELKELINAIHEAGMGVILDGVYTHMYKSDFLEDIVPNYYFFKDKKGNYIGAFGNNVATNRKMAEKLLVDSVKYWHEEYKIDGIRFDMMGDATYEVIQKAYDEAAKINPNTLFLGEGWRTFSGHIDSPELKGKAADQDWMNKTRDVGSFSDDIRNILKSGFGCEGEPRFITGGAQNIEKVFNNIKGQPNNFETLCPANVVQYIEAHDNLPLYDVIAQSIKKDPDKKDNEAEIHKRIRIGNAIVLTSQGIAFIHAGQEYGRTKQWFGEKRPEQKYHILKNKNGKEFKHPYFIYDSYNASDAINKFDWKKALNYRDCTTNTDTVAYTKGLIAIRQSTDAFRLGEKELINKNIRLIKANEIKETDLVIAYSCQGTKGDIYYVFINADSKVRGITLDTDLTNSSILADGEHAGIEKINFPKGVKLSKQTIIIDPLTVVIIKK